MEKAGSFFSIPVKYAPCCLLQLLHVLLLEQLPICFPWQLDHVTVPVPRFSCSSSWCGDMCGHTQKPEVVFLGHSPPDFLRQGLWLNLELPEMARLAATFLRLP